MGLPDNPGILFEPQLSSADPNLQTTREPVENNALSQRAQPRTLVTVLRLHYEEILYFVPLYPGTLTFSRAVPNIGLSDEAKTTERTSG